MSIIYQKLGKSIALRANQLSDAISATTLETNYSTNANLDSIMDGVEVPYSALRNDIITAEAQIAAMIGNSSNNLLRAALMANSDILIMKDNKPLDIPVIGTSGKFMGKYDGLYNAVTHLPMQLMEKQVVLRRMRNSGDFFRIKYDAYFVEGTKVFFTCAPAASSCSCTTGTDCTCTKAKAYFRGVAWNKTKAETNFDQADGLGKSVLPDQCADLWRNMVLAGIAQENYFEAQASFYGQKAEQSAIAIGLAFDPNKAAEVVATNTENENAQSVNG